MKIKLVKSSFHNEKDTKARLIKFIEGASVMSMGRETEKFERQFSKKQGRMFSLFVNSGSSANLILLQALQNQGVLKRGDKVGVSALTWATNIMPVIQLGMEPIAIDCEVDTLNVSPRTLKKRIKEIDALFLTNVLGFSDDIRGIATLCKKNKIIFLEDKCESLGSKAHGKLLGNFGLASTFSFFVGHHLSTLEGGMICTDDEDLYHHLILARAHGWDRNLPTLKQEEMREKHGVDDFFSKYTFYDLAYNLRPTDIHGFLGHSQLKYWNDIVKSRERNFRTVHKAIVENPNLVNLRFDHMDIVSNFAVPVIGKDVKTFNLYRKRFENEGVEIRPIIAGDITKQPFYKKYRTGKDDCPNAHLIHSQAFYFGNNPELTERELAFLAKLLQY